MDRNQAWGALAFNTFNYTLLLLIGMATLFPFLNLIAVSLNDPLDSLKGGITLLPREWTLMNYRAILSDDALAWSAVRSVIRTLLGTVLGVTGTVMIAYTLSRKQFIFRKAFNVILVITLYVNGGLIPTYLLIKNLGLMNHFAVYIIPGLIGVFNVIIIRSYFDQLPEGLVESAHIDGATDFQTLFRIVVPISLPVISTITLFIAVGHWNSWFDNNLYASRNPDLSLLQFELQKILLQSVSQVANANEHVDGKAIQSNPDTIRAALTIVVTMPILLVYPFLQRYFVKGVTLAAIKE
ncbi:carbohydrate ABC transporter permease [Paenibacillus lignilyticus]|uniref:Carbohydrate ABC transporter permease n=1 Tax=Paenibacillus lignilyticus TaxID=1172615 RepID=A0ABS5CI61_9BACL|nr:carbohydrate ABC transporter permease [Paenibacillus lignilyticus]MBP3965556.1 carbohydrate ABC transporter permease [Paenibacillus lignilyticus]